MEHGHGLGDAAHELHVVLDHHHGVLAGQAVQELGGVLRFLVRHAGDGLVDQQHPRVLREQHADLEPLLLSVREQARAHLGVLFQPDRLEHALDPLFFALLELGEQRREHALLAGQRQLQILEHGVALKHRRPLELAADAALRDLVLAELRQILIVADDEHGAGVRLGLAGDHVLQRGLAGAVRADDAAQLALVEHQRQVVERLEAVEADADVVDAEQRLPARGERVVTLLVRPCACAAKG